MIRRSTRSSTRIAPCFASSASIGICERPVCHALQSAADRQTRVCVWARYNMVVKWATVAVVLACARIAAAQPDEPPPPPDEPPAPEPQPAPPPPPPAPRTDPGWHLYHETFSELARGKRGHARELAAELMRLHPDHEATALIRGTGLAMPDQPVDLIERPSKSARAELAAFQTLHGIAVGSEVCVIASCKDPTAVLGLVFLGGVAGATISLNVGELTSGERALINSGTIWGAGNAILLAIASDPKDGQTVAGMLLAGQAGGILVGGTLFSKHPTAGQVALANSGGEWA